MDQIKENMERLIITDKEPLLTETKNRYVLYPIKNTDIWSMYKTALSSFWIIEEVDLSKDITDWENKLNENERFFIKHVLAFFAGSDGIVGRNLGARFYDEIMIPEAKAFYGFQIAIENIHNEMYSLMIDTYIKDTTEKNSLFNALEEVPCVKRKGDWAIKWIEDKESSFAKRLMAFAIIEGVFFSGSFCSIFWLKQRNLMEGLCKSNEFISRDESLHTEFAILLYSKIVNKLSEEDVYNMMKEAVDIEIEFITESIPCNMLGMNSILMTEYIKYVADRLLVQLGYNKLYNTKNPFDFMQNIGMENKTNFFESRLSEYSKANVGKTETRVFTLDSDF
jgi:ribonucleotide reductase beta subunit family protein with ferritin-like domain